MIALTVGLAVLGGVGSILTVLLPMPIAVGTSLVVIAMKSFAGFAGYLSSVQVDWTMAAWSPQPPSSAG